MSQSFNRKGQVLKYDIIAFSALTDVSFQAQLKQSIQVASNLLGDVRALTSDLTYENTVGNIDLALDELHRVINPLMRFRSLRSSEEILSTIKTDLPEAENLIMNIINDKDIYQKIKSVSKLKDLSAEQIKVICLILKDFEENGIHLASDKQERHSILCQKIKRLETQFIENIQAAENDFVVIIEYENEIQGIPDSILTLALSRGHKYGTNVWAFSVKGSEYGLAITHGKSVKFRKKLYEKRASLGHGEKFSNNDICMQLLQLRLQKAQLLGFESHAEFKIKQKESCSANYLLDLLESSKHELATKAAIQIKELSRLSSEPVGPWDFHFLKELNQKDKNEISLTFEVDTLMRGIFSVLGRIFQITFVHDESIPVYVDKNVSAYRVEDRNGFTLGIIYLDLFSREGKRSGNMMGYFREKGQYQHLKVIPQIVVSTNIIFDDRDKISLHEVTRILHELGHGLHALLCVYSLPRLNATHNCPMSIIELPSTLLEYLVKIPECLNEFLGRLATEEELSMVDRGTDDPYTELFAISNGIYDLKLHMLTDFSILENWGKYEKENLRTNLQNDSLPENFPASAHSFRHIMAGGYDAGYYSYFLSRHFAAKIFAIWVGAGIFDPNFCEKLRHSIYAQGALLSLESVSIFIEEMKTQIPNNCKANINNKDTSMNTSNFHCFHAGIGQGPAGKQLRLKGIN